MRWTRVFTLVALLAACTKPNEAKHCTAGTCTTPNFPFCDVSGAFSGEAGTCIAITCEPGKFGECRSDAEVRCNATGDNYEVVQCERGCDEMADGCRLCNPNETACTNGKVATCDAAGTVVSSASCPLGCFEDQPRCRDIAPSNSLAMYLDMASNADDLDLSSGGTIITGSGMVFDAGNHPVAVSTFLVPAPPNGAAIRVLVARRVRIGNVSVVSGITNGTSAGGGPALAIVANAEISVEGLLTFWSADAYENGLYSAGGVSFPGCTGGPAAFEHRLSPPQDFWAASGGGGHATPGGKGGGVEFMLAGGAAGAAGGNPALEPLRGGCAGGADSATSQFIWGAGGGGGALQLSSREVVTVGQNAVINANGGPGMAYTQTALYGAGAGGGILLEAPSVRLEAGSKLLVNGGPAATNATTNDLFPPTSETTAPSIGGKCVSMSTYNCANGGNGAAADGPATGGVDVPFFNTANYEFHAAGGGGGLGFIRINTPNATYTKANDVIESGVLTTGMLRTR